MDLVIRLWLFIILFLHQTTTFPCFFPLRFKLFIILFLHQTTTVKNGLNEMGRCLSSCSYIKPQLSFRFPLSKTSCLSSCSYIKPQHSVHGPRTRRSCLSSCSYIKPQRWTSLNTDAVVVYHLVPTSNHNYEENHFGITWLFIILFLHQTTTWFARHL